MGFARFSELALFTTPQQKKQAFRSAIWGLLRNPRYWLWMVGLVTLGSLLPFYMRRLHPALAAGWITTASRGFFGGLGGLTMFWFCRAGIQRSLRRQLLDQGTAVCLHCGYDLRGQERPRCPECGRPFDEALLRVPGEENAGE
ncbi:MAG: hypothetical protein ACE5EX_08235 [Phycisphaerae bacterium]